MTHSSLFDDAACRQQTTNDLKLLLEATWAITNLAAGPPECVEAALHAAPTLVVLLQSSSSKQIAEQSAWALGIRPYLPTWLHNSTVFDMASSSLPFWANLFCRLSNPLFVKVGAQVLAYQARRSFARMCRCLCCTVGA